MFRLLLGTAIVRRAMAVALVVALQGPHHGAPNERQELSEVEGNLDAIRLPANLRVHGPAGNRLRPGDS